MRASQVHVSVEGAVNSEASLDEETDASISGRDARLLQGIVAVCTLRMLSREEHTSATLLTHINKMKDEAVAALNDNNNNKQQQHQQQQQQQQ